MDVSLKVILVGNGMVGKTSMITRFARGVVTENYKKTIGTDFMEKDITLRSTSETIKLLLWDTAGQEMFSSLTRAYYKGSGAVVYVFSTTDRESFLEIERWKEKVEAECGEICSVLVQNKIDLLDQAVVTSAEVENLAKKLNIKLYRTCVRNNVLVDDVFDYLADSFLKNGGAAGLGVDAVQSIGELQTNTTSTATTATNSANNSTTTTGTTTSTTSQTTSSTTGEDEHTNGTSHRSSTSSGTANGTGGKWKNETGSGAAFQLTPLTTRTGGKKKAICTIL